MKRMLKMMTVVIRAEDDEKKADGDVLLGASQPLPCV